MSKQTVCLIFGGQSDEHAISLISANGILGNLDTERYEVQKVGISREGQWFWFRDQAFVDAQDARRVRLAGNGIPLLVNPSKQGGFLAAVAKEGGEAVALPRPHIVFPVLHGPFGEDGRIQGLFEMCGLPYVGSGVLGSSLGMDKAATKLMLQAHDIPVGPCLAFSPGNVGGDPYDWKRVSGELGSDLFVKPANLGSSVGITHVKTKDQYKLAIDLALQHDKKILVEKTIKGRELEIAVLGNHTPRATRAGEIRPKHDFYSYEAKYLDPDGAELLVPSPVKAAVHKELQRLAIATFQALQLRGLSRIDFFYDEKQDACYVNEVNTMPGFTPISMYPKLWELEGLGYRELLNQLIDLGLQP